MISAVAVQSVAGFYSLLAWRCSSPTLWRVLDSVDLDCGMFASVAASTTRGSADAGAGVLRELDDLADDQVGRVVDQVAVQVENFAGAMRVAQHVAGDRPQGIVRADLVDRSPSDAARGRARAGGGSRFGLFSSASLSPSGRSTRRPVRSGELSRRETASGAGKSRSGSVRLDLLHRDGLARVTVGPGGRDALAASGGRRRDR